jgi:hypothetical protein
MPERLNANRSMVASRWPCRLAFAALMSRSTSASIRYSRVRSSAFGLRLGGTVPIKSAATPADTYRTAVRMHRGRATRSQRAKPLDNVPVDTRTMCIGIP